MKNRERYVFSIILLMVHLLGAAGALTTTLKLEWGRVLRPFPFLAGLAFLCALAALIWRPCRWRRLFLRGGVLLTVYVVLLFFCRRGFLNSLAWAMSSAVERINERYDFRLIWSWIPDGDVSGMQVQATLSVLAILVPYVLLLGCGILREHMTAVLLADAVWFCAAAGMDSFPDYIWLVLCVMCLVAQVILRNYRDNVRAGIRAVALGLTALGGIMLAVYFFLLPVMDEGYEKALEARIELSRRVNEEWIPRAQETLAFLISGGPADVTGSLKRNGGKVLTFRDIYRVTLSSAPRTTVYLRGFVGAEYEGNQWAEEEDSRLADYYAERGWELPESGRELVNLTYRALGSDAGYARVEELAGAGSYSLYPYGAELGGEYRVHWDGTADRAGRVSEYSWHAPNGKKGGRLTSKQAEEEKRYRQYVYDCFCDYPAEEFPELTAYLEESGFRKGDIYDRLTAVYLFLRTQAVYDLEAADPPRGKDFVEYFLFESQEGYCAHFASAAVLMLRYLDVPARYVTGYSLSAGDFTKSEEGGYTAIATDAQAHAWAEVYLSGIGWMPVEMTPGALAFTEDASLKQLELAGRLSGTLTEERRTPKIPPAAKKTEKRQEETAEREEISQTGKPLSGQEKGPEGDNGQTANHPGGEQPGSEGGEPSADIPVNTLQPQDGRFPRSRGAVAVMITILAAGFLILLCLGAALGIDRRRRRRFLAADSRERIFLLYRNLRRLLRLSGHEERLEAADRETREFRIILEKSSFGEKEPSACEVHSAAVFCCGIAREEYKGLFFYKKPLFQWMDACPPKSLKEMEIF